MRSNGVGVRPRALAAAVSMVSIMVFLDACTGSGGHSTKPASTKSGGTIPSFAMAMAAAPTSLDLAKNFSGANLMFESLVTEPLERITSTGTAPAIATSVSTPNPTTLVYHIRSGAKFSDGTHLTAADVAWSIQHATDVKAGAQTAGIVQSFKSAAVTGPLTVTVELTKPDPAARGGLAAITQVQQAKFAKAHAKDLGTPTALPIGTGPYMYSSFTTQRVTLVPNPDYVGGPPPVGKLDFDVVSGGDNATQLAMRSNAVDGATISNLKTAPQWQAVSGAHLYSSVALQFAFLSLDTSSGPLSDLHVRKAIAYSVDRAGVMAAGYGKYATLLRGMATPELVGDVAPSLQAAQAFLASLPQYDFDTAKAKAELAQSNYPHGFSLTVPILAGVPYSELVAENLQQNMKQLGVTITLKTVTQQQWLATIYGHKNLALETMSSGVAAPDPSGFIGLYTGKAGIRPQGFNLANWAPPELEDALTTLSTSQSKTERWSATKTILAAIAADVPYIPLFSPNVVVVLGNGFSFDKQLAAVDLFGQTWLSALRKS